MPRRWALTLLGGNDVLTTAGQLFRPPGLIEVGTIDAENGQTLTVAYANTFDVLDTIADVHAASVLLMALINSGIFIHDPHSDRLTSGPVLGFDANGRLGRKHHIMRASIDAVIRVTPVSVRFLPSPEGAELSADAITLAAAAAKFAADDEVGNDVANYLGGELSWFNLYKAFERMRDDVNRRSATNGLSQLAWDNKQVEAFRIAAQVHRHAKNKWPVGYDLTNTMSLQVARSTVSSLAQAWFEWRVIGASKGS